MRARVLLIAGFLWALSGCGPSGPVPAAEFGEQLFFDSRMSPSEFNVVSCASCHSNVQEPNKVYPGHTLANSAFRAAWWGGNERRLLDAINDCYAYFMRGYPPLTEDDPRAKALDEYLVSISPDTAAPTLPFTVVRDITGELPRGSVARGKQVYEQSCAVCHGAIHSAAGRPSELAPTLPEVTSTYATDFPGVSPATVVVEKVRHGAFFGIGGTMPPYGQQMLSDEDLGAVLAYLGL